MKKQQIARTTMRAGLFASIKLAANFYQKFTFYPMFLTCPIDSAWSNPYQVFEFVSLFLQKVTTKKRNYSQLRRQIFDAKLGTKDRTMLNRLQATEINENSYFSRKTSGQLLDEISFLKIVEFAPCRI